MYNKYMPEQKYRKKNRIGKRLKKLLEEKEISVDQLSNETGISRSVLFDYVKEKRNPSEQNLVKIASYFNVPREYLTNNFHYYDESLFIYISKLRDGLFMGFHKVTANQMMQQTRYERIKKKYIRLFESLNNYYKSDFLSNFYKLIMKGLFMYMSGNTMALQAEIIPNDREHIGQRLNAAIKASNLSVKEVSKLCGVERSLIQNYISGRLNPSDKTLEKITNGLNLPEKFFIADSRNGVIRFGDSYLYSPIKKSKSNSYKYDPDEKTIKKTHQLYYKYWKEFDDIFGKLSQPSKEQIIRFLEECFDKLESHSLEEQSNTVDISDNE